MPDYDSLKAALLKCYHDHPIAGHMGRNATIERLSQDYYWRGMVSYVEKWSTRCPRCRRVKSNREGHHGPLRPLDVAQRAWRDLSMDFIVKLPESQGHDAIFVVVDRLTKYKHFIPCKEKHTGAEHVAQMYLDRVWKHHGLPERIVSDRGSQFVGDFWKQLTKRLDIKSFLSTTAHPETDGQTERANA